MEQNTIQVDAWTACRIVKKRDMLNTHISGTLDDFRVQNQFGNPEIMITGRYGDIIDSFKVQLNQSDAMMLKQKFGADWSQLKKDYPYKWTVKPTGKQMKGFDILSLVVED